MRDRRASFVDLRDGPVDPGGGHDHGSCDGYVSERQDGTLEYLFAEAKLRAVCGGKAQALRSPVPSSQWKASTGSKTYCALTQTAPNPKMGVAIPSKVTSRTKITMFSPKV